MTYARACPPATGFVSDITYMREKQFMSIQAGISVAPRGGKVKCRFGAAGKEMVYNFLALRGGA